MCGCAEAFCSASACVRGCVRVHACARATISTVRVALWVPTCVRNGRFGGGGGCLASVCVCACDCVCIHVCGCKFACMCVPSC